MNDFIKNRDKIVNKPAGLDYELISGKIYDLLWDAWDGYTYLKENGNFNLPKKIYEIEGDTKFMDRVLAYYNSDTNNSNLGILLSGTKGTGKTMLAKRIAIKSNLPVVVVDTSYPLKKISSFFKKINTSVCIIFDEIEKNEFNWPSTSLLEFLDGVQSTGKNIIIMTSNDTDKLNDNLFDRCSRIRYWRKYNATLNENLIKTLIEDKQIKEVDALLSTISKFKVQSFDNINCFLDEYKSCLELNKDTTTEEIINEMNITLK
jgi:SpoVK/Ycf46/Vps4 family AAA+-type ATPase